MKKIIDEQYKHWAEIKREVNTTITKHDIDRMAGVDTVADTCLELETN